MSKIICDFCGTSYADTAKQCPICGSVRPGDAQRSTNDVKSNGSGSAGYTYVKGGRFSKGNVKKRNNAATKKTEKSANTPKKQNQPEEKDNRGLVITAIVLLVLIIVAAVYVFWSQFGRQIIPDPTDNSTLNQGVVQIACTNIVLDIDELLFEDQGAVRLLNVTAEPSNTTDTIKFRSENPAVVTVNNDGKVTVVGEGMTNIVITCGKITKKCPVKVMFNATAGTENTEGTTGTENPDKTDGNIRLNRQDMTISQKGGTWNLYSGDVAKNLVTFTSDNESVVTFIDGVVTAVGSSYDGVWVHAEYNGQKVSCLVRCSFSSGSSVEGNGGVTEDGGSSGTSVKGTVLEGINVRSGAGQTYSTIGTLLPGDIVTITERKHDGVKYEWGKITYGNTVGWIALDFVKLG